MVTASQHQVRDMQENRGMRCTANILQYIQYILRPALYKGDGTLPSSLKQETLVSKSKRAIKCVVLCTQDASDDVGVEARDVSFLMRKQRVVSATCGETHW